MSRVRTITTPEKHYDSDPAKAKVHTMLGEMLDATLLTFRKPSEIKVLHFAGIDAQETKAVYLSRGILPQNITTLERDPEIARAIESQSLGIKIINSDLEDYVRETARFGHNVISLDFTGPLSDSTMSSIGKLLHSSTERNIVLHTANLLRRNREEFLAVTGIDAINTSPRLMGTGSNYTFLADSLERDQSDLNKDNLKELRLKNYPYLILDSILVKDNDGIMTFLNFLNAEFNRQDDLTISKLIKGALRENEISKKSGVDKFSEPIFHDIRRIHHNMRSAYAIIHALGEPYGLTGRGTELLIESLQNACINPYMPQKNTNYSYISESGSPMSGSIFYLQRSKYLYDAACDVARACGFPIRFQINDIKGFTAALKVYRRIRANQHDAYYDVIDHQATEIHFLGNSSRPVLTKKRFLEALEEGLSIDQIQKKFRGWAAKPLAQWKAHHTMGTYDTTRQDEQETITVTADDKDVERISKDEALELLSAGIPPKEIFDAYPTSFTTRQLGALKAHITMGTYIRD